MKLKRSVLVVDDDPDIWRQVQELLGGLGFEVVLADSVEVALACANSRDFDCIVSELRMPGTEGAGLIEALRDRQPDAPLVCLTGFRSLDVVVESMQRGASDCVPKPLYAPRLLIAVERALEEQALATENRRLRALVERTASCGDLVGKSLVMNEIYALIRKISNNRSNVMVTGERGTGKEIVARTIHLAGGRSQHPFISVHCASLSGETLERELFGSVRGAFAGAHRDTPGVFELAGSGTLFLDEVADLTPTAQGKLLRILRDREVRPLGAKQSVPIDVRLIAATQRDLRRNTERGLFREDLYYKLNVIPIQLPSLRERPEDIPLLAQTFVERWSGGLARRLSEGAMRKLQCADWPGNVDELESCLERSLALAEGVEIKASEVLIPDDRIRADGSLEESVVGLARQRGLSLEVLEDLYIEAVLEATGGRKSEAARVLGVNRRTLYRREERRQKEAAEGGAA
jgi:two-component system response regulator HydG